ncbi:DUF262 domain-containing protein [Mycoplasmopsis gallinarum]|uniref:GmrSD restriction endonucleases N-terminal domain-containing protein n=1 Tax=Mycoplasmopsis gallinarum TaxID=29557 RepID=A0A162QHK6_9BACT|nr:DUF262 domain-containing protein [Mycoplasmopsis gallinarum]OAB48640.1 hypothetical protein MGALLINA_06060 [Mycoplasmopsis gallinarum]
MNKIEELLKNKKSYLKQYWTIGTNVYSYLKGTIFEWIDDNYFRDRIERNDGLSEFKFWWDKKEKKIDSDFLSSQKIFYYSSKKENVNKDSTIKQLIFVLRICGILEDNEEKQEVSEKINVKFLELIKRELKNNSTDEKLKEEIQKYIGDELLKKFKLYLNHLNWINNNDDDLILDENSLKLYFRDVLYNKEKNWVYSCLSDYIKIKRKNHYWLDLVDKCCSFNDEQLSKIENIFQELMDIKNDELCAELLTNYINFNNNLFIASDEYFDEKNNSPKIPNKYSLEFLSEFKTKEFENYNSVISSVLNYFNLLLSKSWKLNIPLFQRTYTWDVNFIETLFNDILKLSSKDTELDSIMSPHYLGSVVFSISDEKEDMQEIDIIDGQQRTTTLFIFVFALLKFLFSKEMKIPNIFKQLFDYQESKNAILNLINNIGDIEVYDKLKDLFEISNESYKKWNEIEDNNIKDNLLYTFKLLKKEFDTKPENEIEKFVRAFFKSLILNLIFVSNKTAETIFEKINFQSKPLNNLNLFKSYVYAYYKQKRNLSDEEIKEKVDFIQKNFISDFEKNKKGDEDTKKLNKFLDLLIFRIKNLNLENQNENQKINSINSSYEKFKFLINNFDKLNIDSWEFFLFETHLIFEYLNSKNWESFQKKWENKFSNVFKRIDQNKFNELYKNKYKDNLELIFPFVYLTNVHKQTVFIELVWSILETSNYLKSKDKNNVQDLNKDMALLFEVERFSVIWNVAYFKGQSLSQKSREIAAKILKEEIQSPKDLRKELFSIFTQYNKEVDNKKIVFEKFKNDIENKLLTSYETKNSMNELYIRLFSRVEWYLENNHKNLIETKLSNSKEVDILDFKQLFNVTLSWEHYYPQKPKIQEHDEEWDAETINKIGNGFPLNLTDNKILKNGSIVQKYKELKEIRYLKNLILIKGYENSAGSNDLQENLKYPNQLIGLSEKFTKKDVEDRTKIMLYFIKKIYTE